MKKSYSWKTRLLLLMPTLLIALIASEIITYSHNTLQSHTNWISGNLLLANPSMGAGGATITRNLLSQNRLNLHEWHGYQEVLLDRVFQLGSLRLSLKLEENAYICLIYNKTAGRFSGVRISRNPQYENIFFEADNDGRFLTKQAIPNLRVDDGCWHTVELKFADSQLELWWDSIRACVIPDVSLYEQVCGFRSGGPYQTIIDNVEISDDSGILVIRENFRNSTGYWRIFFFALAVSIVGICFIFVVAAVAGFTPVTTSRWIFLVEALVITVLVFYLVFDYFFYSKIYPYKDIRAWQSVQFNLLPFEKIRQGLFSRLGRFAAVVPCGISDADAFKAANFLKSSETDTPEAGFLEMQMIWSGAQAEEARVISIPHLIEFFKRNDCGSLYKIIFLGTSQTWGEGAVLRKNQLVFQVYRFLQDSFGSCKRILAVNAAQRAADSSAMLKILMATVTSMQPEIVVVNLANNDSTAGFRENLMEIYELSRQHGADVIFVKEANSPDSVNGRLMENHQTIEDLAQKDDITLVDMHSYLSSDDVIDSGFIWWDSVHLTAYGQTLAAQFMAEAMSGSLRTHSGLPNQ